MLMNISIEIKLPFEIRVIFKLQQLIVTFLSLYQIIVIIIIDNLAINLNEM